MFSQQIFIEHLHVASTALGSREVAGCKTEQNAGLCRAGIIPVGRQKISRRVRWIRVMENKKLGKGKEKHMCDLEPDGQKRPDDIEQNPRGGDAKTTAGACCRGEGHSEVSGPGNEW